MTNVKELVSQPINGIHSLGEYPSCKNLDELDADIAIIGVPLDISELYCSGTRFAPKTIRDNCELLTSGLNESYNPKWGAKDPNQTWKVVDCGDVEVVHGDLEQTYKNIERKIEKIVSKGAIPAVLGGDHSITVPVAKALKNKGSFYTIQIDAFLDFANHKSDQLYGQGNPMRRLSEMEHVEGMAQLGIRGIGSNRQEDLDDAKEYGSTILSLREMREIGMKEILNRIPDAERYFITIDTDGLDLSTTPDTASNDGLYYYEVHELLEGLVKKGEVIGFDFVELDPSDDQTGNTTQMIARMAHDLIDLILIEKGKSK